MDKKIYKEGIYTRDDIPENIYHSDPLPAPGMSSGLATIITKSSLLHAKTSHPKFGNVGIKQTQNMAFGSLCHALLEGEREIKIIESDSFRTNAAKDERAAAVDQGIPYGLRNDYDRACAVNDSLSKQTDAFNSGKNEITIIWKDRDFGIWCRIRCDNLSDDLLTINDYKTTQGSAEPEKWCRSQLWSEHKYLQAALYCRGVKHFTGVRPEFNFIVQEVGNEPYAVSTIWFDDHSAQYYADHKLEVAMAKWKDALESGRFPSYRETTATLPGYLDYELESMIYQPSGDKI